MGIRFKFKESVLFCCYLLPRLFMFWCDILLMPFRGSGESVQGKVWKMCWGRAGKARAECPGPGEGHGPRGETEVVEKEGEAKPKTSICRDSGRARGAGEATLKGIVIHKRFGIYWVKEARGRRTRRWMKIWKL